MIDKFKRCFIRLYMRCQDSNIDDNSLKNKHTNQNNGNDHNR